MIIQHLYWPGIVNTSKIKYSKSHFKLRLCGINLCVAHHVIFLFLVAQFICFAQIYWIENYPVNGNLFLRE